MARKEVGFGVVGLGMGGHHCLAIDAAKGARLAAVCDTDPERLDTVVKRHGCRGHARYADLLKDPEVEVVSVVTESAYHAEMGIMAARAGKHLVMEKPVDITPARMDRLERAVAAAGVKCGCVFQSRMSPVNTALKQAVDRGKLGKLIGVHAGLPWFRAPEYFLGPHGPWRGTWAVDGGGSMMNQGIHTVDLMIFLAGPVAEVSGFYGVFDHDIEAEDHAVAALRFAGGALGTVYTTTCARPEGSQHLFLFGSGGSFRMEGPRLSAYDAGTARERAKMLERFGGAAKDAAASDAMAVATDGHTLIMADMARAVREDREPCIPIRAARHAVEVVCAVYRAGRTGRTVKLQTPAAR